MNPPGYFPSLPNDVICLCDISSALGEKGKALSASVGLSNAKREVVCARFDGRAGIRDKQADLFGNVGKVSRFQSGDVVARAADVFLSPKSRYLNLHGWSACNVKRHFASLARWEFVEYFIQRLEFTLKRYSPGQLFAGKAVMPRLPLKTPTRIGAKSLLDYIRNTARGREECVEEKVEIALPGMMDNYLHSRAVATHIAHHLIFRPVPRGDQFFPHLVEEVRGRFAFEVSTEP